MGKFRLPAGRLLARGWRIFLLVYAIAVCWCVLTNRTSLWKWNVPPGYMGDNLQVMAWAKDAAEGHYWPLLAKYNPSLGAPSVANWNDYPVTEDTLVFFLGCLVKMFGLFAGYNVMALIAQLLAGVSFYLTCRWLRVGWEWAFAGGMIFAFSTFALLRVTWGHVLLNFYWHIPPCILVCWWMGSRRGLDPRGGRFWFALAVGFATGIQNPYYTNLFLQFAGFAFLAQLIRRSPWKKLVAPVAVGAVTFCGFLLMNLDTLQYQAVNGKNPAAVERNYVGLEVYALKPTELIVPSVEHRVPWMANAGRLYRNSSLFHGEGFQSSYLGITGIAALPWLLCYTVYNALRRPARAAPGWTLEIGWIVAYAMVGGGNCILGLFGLQLFRGTNRFSIWILALLLLFLARRLDRLTRSWPFAARAGLAILLCAVALLDQAPKMPRTASLEQTKAVIDSDRGLVEKLSAALPAGAMVFQLPVADYPESLPIVGMTDYEHLRPYLYSTNLRYSYGSDKGRPPGPWQHETGAMQPADMIARLEASGFGAIWINRNGYADKGEALIGGLRDAGRGETIESARGDLLCVLLHPAPPPGGPGRP